jgi:hypothetical protein
VGVEWELSGKLWFDTLDFLNGHVSPSTLRFRNTMPMSRRNSKTLGQRLKSQYGDGGVRTIVKISFVSKKCGRQDDPYPLETLMYTTQYNESYLQSHSVANNRYKCSTKQIVFIQGLCSRRCLCHRTAAYVVATPNQIQIPYTCTGIHCHYVEDLGPSGTRG